MDSRLEEITRLLFRVAAVSWLPMLAVMYWVWQRKSKKLVDGMIAQFASVTIPMARNLVATIDRLERMEQSTAVQWAKVAAEIASLTEGVAGLRIELRDLRNGA